MEEFRQRWNNAQLLGQLWFRNNRNFEYLDILKSWYWFNYKTMVTKALTLRFSTIYTRWFQFLMCSGFGPKIDINFDSLFTSHSKIQKIFVLWRTRISSQNFFQNQIRKRKTSRKTFQVKVSNGFEKNDRFAEASKSVRINKNTKHKRSIWQETGKEFRMETNSREYQWLGIMK